MLNAIKHLCPGIADADFVLQDDGAGPYIKRWFWTGPQPTAEQLQAAQPVAEFAAQKSAELLDFRTKREQYLNRVAGIGFAAKEAGDEITVAAAVAVRNGLLDLPSHPSVTTATDIDALKLAIRSRYAEIVGTLPAEAKAAFKKVDQ